METAKHLAASLLAAALAVAGANCSAQNRPVNSTGAPPPQRNLPPPSADVGALLDRLELLAASTAASDQAELARRLGERATLDQLDEPEIRDRSRTEDLHLARVIDTLRNNPSPAAGQTLAALARDGEFTANDQRSELLVRASATRRPLPPELAAFLDTQARADSVNLHYAVDALCENGTGAAWDVVGRKLLDDAIEPEYKVAWIRDPLLKQRRNAAMLELAEKLLRDDSFDRELRVALAEALFDYRPKEWYPGGEGLPRPPAESATSAQAAAVLRRIGAIVAAPAYPKAVRDAARRTLASLD